MDKYTSGTIDSHSAGLKKHKITVFTAVFMVFSLVAAGAYGIEEMIPQTGPGLALIMLIVIPFIWGLPFGLVASELGSVRPQEGGYYKWVQEAFGEFWGFQAGWWRTISIYIDNTLYVVLAGGYMFSMLNTDNRLIEFAFKAAMILIFMYINIRGVRDVGIVTNALSIFVIAAFAMVAIIGFANWGGNPFATLTPEPVEFAADWIFYVGAGLSIGMWMYSGYESMSTFAGELKDPQVIPKATLITVPLIMLTYILPTMAGVSALDGTGNPDLSFENWGIDPGMVGYGTVAEVFLGPAFAIFFGVVAVIAQCSIYNTYIASGSRGFFALSDDHLSPKMFVKVDKKYGVPYVTVISIAVVNLALCMFDFRVLIVVDVFLLVSSYILVYLSAMKLRKKIPREEYKFRIPGGMGLLRVICIVPICVAVISFLINGSDYFFGGMLGIISGPIIYFIWKRHYGGLAKKDPVEFPVNKKTGLALGDTKRLAVLFGLLAAIGLIGCFFLPWYEQDWEYIQFAASGESDYDLTLFASQQALFGAIQIMTILCAGLAVIFGFVSRAIEPKNNVEKANKAN
jgi:amino acid transporter